MRFGSRLWAFPLLGLGAGVLFCIVAARAYVSSAGSSSLPPFAQLAAIYLIAGALGGLILAVAFPLVRWVGGAFLVGALALFPMYFGMGLIDHGAPNNDRLFVAAVAAVAVGGTAGAREWLDENRTAYSLLQVWTFAGGCSIIAWVVGLHWAGEWPAAIAALVFLIPTMLALFVTLDRRHRGDSDRAA
jgi:hypothetical protein